jgi:hypothetical protein
VRRGLFVLICAACCAACSTQTRAQSTPRVAAPSRSLDLVFVFVRDWAAKEDVELNMVRKNGRTTITLLREARPGRPRVLLDSIAAGEKAPEQIETILDSFDLWAMNAPDAPGAACKTVRGRRSCAIAFKDYSLVMQVERGRAVRVQRYTGLDRNTGNKSARALGDIILTWARQREAAKARGGDVRLHLLPDRLAK